MIIYICEKVTNKCQNLSDQFPHIVTDLPAVCVEALDKADPDETLTLLVYEAHHSHILRVKALNPASGFPLPDIGQRIRGILKRFVALHLQQHRLELTGQHYALVAEYFMDNHVYAHASM